MKHFLSRLNLGVCAKLFCVILFGCLSQATEALHSDYIIWSVLGGGAVLFNWWCELKHRYDDAPNGYMVAGPISALFMFAIGLSEISLLRDNSFMYPCIAYVAILFGSFIAMWDIVTMVLHLSQRQGADDALVEGGSKKIAIMVSFLPIVYCLFLFIAEYPGFLSPDSYDQLCQAMGRYSLCNAHPILHTLIIRLMYRIGMLFSGSTNVAVAIYSVGQILFLSAAFFVAMASLHRRGASLTLIGIIVLWYAIHPVHLFYSITMWKNVAFGGAALIMTVSLSALIGKQRQRPVNIIGFIVGSLLFCLILVNGFAAYFLFLLVCAPYLLKKGYKRLVGIALLCFIVAFICRGPLISLAGIRSTAFAPIEPLSVPMQQVARVIVEGEKLEDGEVELVSCLLSPEKIVETYNPIIYDPIKYAVVDNVPTFERRKKEYLLLWMKLGIRYPGAYIRAWVDLTRGYWSAGCRPRWSNLAFDVADYPDVGLSASANESMCHKKMKEYALLFEGWTGAGVLKSVESIGLHLWLLIIAFGVCIYKKSDMWMLWVPQFAVIGTLLIAVPLNHEVRYAYSLFTCFPFLVCLPFLRQR